MLYIKLYNIHVHLCNLSFSSRIKPRFMRLVQGSLCHLMLHVERNSSSTYRGNVYCLRMPTSESNFRYLTAESITTLDVIPLEIIISATFRLEVN